MDKVNKLGFGAAAVGLGIVSWATWPSPRERFLNVARRELGSRDWPKYTKGVVYPPGVPEERPYWCGVFALWALHKAGYACDVMWNVLTGRGFLYLLKPTTSPKPGDVGYLHAYQHHAIVERVTRDGMVHTIDGNVGPDSRVARRVRPKTEFSFFYDTSPLFERKC